MTGRLSPAIQKKYGYRIFGFDTETFGKNNDFVLGSVFSDDYHRIFYDKKEMITEFSDKKYASAWIAATNLGFDWNCLFANEPQEEEFSVLYRGSQLIKAVSYISRKKNTGYSYKKKNNDSRKITFIDTYNYARISVEKAGKILGIKKLDKPTFLGRYPKSQKEWDILAEYNLRDSEISFKLINFLFRSFRSAGADIKPTIASVSMSLFKNKYLYNTYFPHEKKILVEQLKGYYGANTHAFARGPISNYYYYDVNSLYPYVMLNEYPDPNTMQITQKNSIEYIRRYKGLSRVSVLFSEKNKYSAYPLLPVRYDNKLIYPVGSFTGWYTHDEINYAVQLGYEIKKIHKIFYYKKNCLPFRNFILEMYRIRKKYKKIKSPVEFTYKLMMNSLYGKFGQKFEKMPNFIHANKISICKLNLSDKVERFGNYFKITKDNDPPNFSFPIWALHTTAYARMKLHESLIKYNPVYCDTDSIFIKRKIEASDKLGDFKLENKIKNGIIVKPKFYLIDNVSKIKGLSSVKTKKDFLKILTEKCTYEQHFVKFRESIRRNIPVNSIIRIKKNISLNDNKRIWPRKNFNPKKFEWSRPIRVKNGIPCFSNPNS